MDLTDEWNVIIGFAIPDVKYVEYERLSSGNNYSKNSKSLMWVREYERRLVHPLAPFEKFDFVFCNFLNQNLASRMYGARPYTVISKDIS